MNRLFKLEGPLAQCQLVETALLNIVNFQTLIATKAARIRSVIDDEPLMEFGTRRAQEMDAAIWGTRAAVIGGAMELVMYVQVSSLEFGFRGLTLMPWFKSMGMTIRLSRLMPQLTVIVSFL